MAALDISPSSSIAAAFANRDDDQAIGYSKRVRPISVADSTVDAMALPADPRQALPVRLSILADAAVSSPAGSYIDPSGLAVIDAAGAAVVADPHYASPRTLAALRLLASRPDLDEYALLAVVHASTLAGNKAALTRRVRTAIGADTGAVLYRIEHGKVVMAEATRRSLARHFGFSA